MVSIKEKSWLKTVAGEVQGDEYKRTTDEVSKQMRRRPNYGPILTIRQAQGKRFYCLGGVRHKGGVTLIQALGRNVGSCRPDVKGETQVEDP